MDRLTTANSTFAIGGVSCSADSLVESESFVLRINIGGKNPAHRKSATRLGTAAKNPTRKALARKEGPHTKLSLD